ncbi:MAG: AMP-binding enzyme, partial [Solirubrobacteraceae bacterium]
VTPVDVEEAVASHPAVRRVVVFGRPDRRLGERIVAALTASGDPPDLEEIRGWLGRSGLARSKWPDAVIVLDELPRTPSGKIDRARVRDELLARSPAL